LIFWARCRIEILHREVEETHSLEAMLEAPGSR